MQVTRSFNEHIYVKMTLLAMLLAALTACTKDPNPEFAEVEGIVQISMIPRRELDGNRIFLSQIDLITEDAVLLLFIDAKTQFIDSEVDEGVLQLGHLYRAETADLNLPEDSNDHIIAEVDATRLLKRLEYLGPSGPDAPTREKVRRLKAFRMIPEVTTIAERISATYSDMTNDIFDYEPPGLSFISQENPASCDIRDASTQMKYRGTFYCHPTETVFVDQAWMLELKAGLGATVDHDIEYMLAHSYAHHIQNLSGNYVERPRNIRGKSELIKSIVKFELQADCLAGALLKKIAPPSAEIGDVAEAMGSVSALGDGALQIVSDTIGVPDSLVHGTGDERLAATVGGFDVGSVKACL